MNIYIKKANRFDTFYTATYRIRILKKYNKNIRVLCRINEIKQGCKNCGTIDVISLLNCEKKKNRIFRTWESDARDEATRTIAWNIISQLIHISRSWEDCPLGSLAWHLIKCSCVFRDGFISYMQNSLYRHENWCSDFRVHVPVLAYRPACWKDFGRLHL